MVEINVNRTSIQALMGRIQAPSAATGNRYAQERIRQLENVEQLPGVYLPEMIGNVKVYDTPRDSKTHASNRMLTRNGEAVVLMPMVDCMGQTLIGQFDGGVYKQRETGDLTGIVTKLYIPTGENSGQLLPALLLPDFPWPGQGKDFLQVEQRFADAVASMEERHYYRFHMAGNLNRFHLEIKDQYGVASEVIGAGKVLSIEDCSTGEVIYSFDRDTEMAAVSPEGQTNKITNGHNWQILNGKPFVNHITSALASRAAYTIGQILEGTFAPKGSTVAVAVDNDASAAGESDKEGEDWF